MATDFAVFLRRFLTAHLAGLRGCSPNTIASYRDTFKLLITYLRDERSIPAAKLTLDHLDAAAITGFLEWLQVSRHNSASTRNQRLAAISSFCTWMQTEDPARMACYQNILAIPAKKQPRPGVNHLSVEQTRLLLAAPDRSTRRGRRDATLLATLYDTAMHLYEAGVPLPYIRDILGHVDLSTTEIYARASTEAKRKALETAYTDIVTDDLPEWNQDPALLDWLTNL
ncbi:MAG: integrase/recombinase XerD [Mycobacterium sp.]|jgi:site-specific recombinase XerD|uniref:tyrosine-type recombinase/integrase n=1 Tax=Mycobacterium sp. TaxID=1785 RepID=UPI0028B7D05E|nr:site-specific integrase [Mycobacterium sp.]MDT5114420.1 integrase/recombinase XerD [Mycobacterium sp.]